MAPYSMDLRERVAAAVDHREGSQREIARRFRVSLSFIVRLQQRRKAGTLAPKPHGGGPKPALSHRDQQRLRQLIRKQNDATLKQLKQRGGFHCTLTTIWNTLRRLGLTYKKKTLRAEERNRPDVQKKRRRFRREVGRIEPKRLIFVDETGVNTAMTPTHASGASRRTSLQLGPHFLGDGNRHRRAGPGRGPGTTGVPWRHRCGGVPDVRELGVGARVACGRSRGV